MLFSDPAVCRLDGSWPVTAQCDDIVVITVAYKHARQVAAVHQEPDLAAERLSVSSLDFQR